MFLCVHVRAHLPYPHEANHSFTRKNMKQLCFGWAEPLGSIYSMACIGMHVNTFWYFLPIAVTRYHVYHPLVLQGQCVWDIYAHLETSLNLSNQVRQTQPRGKQPIDHHKHKDVFHRHVTSTNSATNSESKSESWILRHWCNTAIPQ